MDLLRLTDPLLALDSLKGVIVIDEVQRIPELFRILRVLVDRDNKWLYKLPLALTIRLD